MKWFDKHVKLREQIRHGRLHTEQKDILSLLKGKVAKEDVPACVVEPAGDAELADALAFAGEKQMRVALSSGGRPLGVKALGGHMLILTTRLAGPPSFSADRHSVRVAAGMSAEALSVDLARAGRRWLPLWPIPGGESIGGLVATAWEGLRTWGHGGLLESIRSLDWLSYDGRKFSTGSAASGMNAPDVSPFLYGSFGTLGIITSLELSLEPVPAERTAAIFELRDAHDAAKLLTTLREMESPPETAVYWGAAATDFIRRGNDNTISDSAEVTLLAEWNSAVEWPMEWLRFASPVTDSQAIQALWQDVFRMPRTAARLCPARVEARLRLPAAGLEEVERLAREMGRDTNLTIAVWGTVEGGWLQIWALQPDEEARTHRRAEEAVGRIVQMATELGGASAPLPPGATYPHRNGEAATARDLAHTVRSLLLKRCDPGTVYIPTNAST
ncbi:FAD-binding oxidoreductase [candidate division KSB1 bacterium]|nr:FAD-binding oxidoreductase [candidate division KSB1 bacterium]